LIARIMSASASGSKQRTSEASICSRSAAGGPTVGRRGRRAQLNDVAEQRDVDLREQRLRHRARSHPRRGLACGCALQHVAGVVEPVFLHAGEIGVAGAGLRQRAGRLARRRLHLLRPFPGRPLAVADEDRDRRTERAAVAYAAEELRLILLEPHARAPAVAEAAAGEFMRDGVDFDR
jgi:hypothetical protein